MSLSDDSSDTASSEENEDEVTSDVSLTVFYEDFDDEETKLKRRGERSKGGEAATKNGGEKEEN